MKTLLITITAIFLLGVTIPTTTPVSKISPITEYIYTEEGYINDIPFDTERIANDSKTFEMEEEGYIDDIPFDTKKVIKNIK